MSVYSNWNGPKSPRDFWPTVDPDAVKPLLPWISGRTYAEPCYGDGSLVRLIGNEAKCNFKSDLEPQEISDGIYKINALELTRNDLGSCDYIITNPPFSWGMLEPLVNHFITLKPTWLLLRYAFLFNKNSKDLIEKSTRLQSIGRLRWGKQVRKYKDDYVWVFWPKDAVKSGGSTFYV